MAAQSCRGRWPRRQCRIFKWPRPAGARAGVPGHLAGGPASSATISSGPRQPGHLLEGGRRQGALCMAAQSCRGTWQVAPAAALHFQVAQAQTALSAQRVGKRQASPRSPPSPVSPPAPPRPVPPGSVCIAVPGGQPGAGRGRPAAAAAEAGRLHCLRLGQPAVRGRLRIRLPLPAAAGGAGRGGAGRVGRGGAGRVGRGGAGRERWMGRGF